MCLVKDDYEEIARNACVQIERNVLVNKPYLIHIIQYGKKNISNKEANEIVKRMITEGRIDENLALSKKEKPYSFYTTGVEGISLAKIICPLIKVLEQQKELALAEASRLTGYSELVVRALLTHLLLEGRVDYKGDLESPVFHIPWDEK